MKFLSRLSWFQGTPVNRRTPDAVFLMSMLTLLGIGQAVTGVRPGSLQEFIPPLALMSWTFSLIIFGAATVIGMALPPMESIIGMYLEMVGRAVIAVTSTVYVAGLLIGVGLNGLFPAGIVTGIILACVVRATQLYLYLRRLRVAVDAALASQGDE